MTSSTNNQGSIVPANGHSVESFEKSYTPAGDKKCSHGRDYQYKVIMYLLCKQLNANSEEFRLACEMEDAGKFDDIVLHYVEGNEWKYKLFQLKHISDNEKNIKSEKMFFPKKSSFSLNMYFDSFKEEIQDKNFETKHKGKITELALMTNVRLEFSNQRHKNIFEECNEEIGTLYEFKKDHIELVKFLKGEPSLREKVFDRNGNLSLVAVDFFNKLTICVNFRDERIEQETKKEIKKFLKDDDEAKVNNIYKDLYNTIAGWVCDPLGNFVGRQECMEWIKEARGKIQNPSNVFSEFHLNRIETHGIRFTEDSLREFGNIFEQNAYICHVKTRCSVDFSLVKVVQCLKKGTFRVISDDEFKTYDQNRLISDLRLNEVSVLVIACSSCETALDIPSWERVRFIIVSKSISLSANNVQCIDDDIQFNELVPSKQQELLEKEVLFQTRRMKLEQVFRPNIRNIIRNEFLFKLITSADPIEVVPSADMLRSTDASYIGRRVTYSNEIDINRFDFNDKDDVYVFSGMTETDFQNLRVKKSSKNRYDLSSKDMQPTDSKEKHETENLLLLPEQNPDQEFKLLCELNDKKNILWIEHSESKFYLHKSHGSMKHVRNFICERVTNQFDDHQLTDRSGDLTIICASPGMGKTTLLSRLASKFIEQHRNTWVIYVNLMDYVREFEARKTFDDKSSTEFIVISQHFDKFEENLFAVWPKITILFDAFDEIAPDHRQPVVDLVTSLNKTGRFKIYITSRPNEQEYLEDEFSRLCHQLAPFNKEDAVSFLKKRWNSSGNGDEARSKRFIEVLIHSVESSTINESGLLMNTPLECRLIGDVYEKEYKDYVDPRNDLPLPKRVDLLELFEEFVRLKWRIYVEEKTQRDIDPALPANRKDRENSLKLFKENHQLASIYLLFGDEIDFENVKTHHYECILERKEKGQLERFLKAIESGEEKTGIIESVRDGTPKYTHRMFAEYFAAEFFHELIKYDQEKSREFLTKTIFQSERKTLKHFFDLLSIKGQKSSGIFKSLLNGDGDRFDDLIGEEESSTFINSKDQFGRNALHLCATYEFDNIFKQLLRYEFDMNARDDFFGYTPVQYACVAQMWKNLDLLLPKSDENITNFISDKEQCLLHASKNGYKEIVINLMEHTEATHRGELINTIDGDEKTPLYYAAMSGHACLSKYILEETGVNLNHKYDSYGNTILHLLAGISEERDGSVEIVRLLANTDLVNTRNTDGRTPLHHAAYFASKSVCECLLNANKADVFVTDNSKLTVLHILAATHDQEKIRLVSELVARGISIDARDVFGRTPLHFACAFGSRAHCEYLIKEMKADIKAVDNENRTTLHRLAANTKENMAEVARLLVSEGISIEARDVFGRTPLHDACEFGSRAHCEYLIKEMKADIKAVDNENRTTLHRLAANTEENMAEVARLLVSEGISIEARDVFGRTPLHFACEFGSRAHCEYLIKEMNADIMAVDNENRNSFHYLGRSTNEHMVEVARLLVSKCTSTDVCDQNLDTRLRIVLNFGFRALYEYLLAEMKTDINAIKKRKRTSLRCVVL